MRIARIDDGSGTEARWAIVDADLGTITALPGSIGEWAAEARHGRVPAGAAQLQRASSSSMRFRAPVEIGTKVVCVGLNYRKHVEGVPGNTVPDAPVAFIKAPTAIIAHDEPIRYPSLTTQLDHEGELVVVIGAARRDVAGFDEMILGYTIGNDVTARDLQRGPRGHDLYSGKSLDDTCGIGPWITTFDEIGADPDLSMEVRVNGERRQHDRTSSMIWNVRELLAYVDARTRLCPGDLVFTGTPAGAGVETGRFLAVGDVVEVEIESIGVLRNEVAAPLTGM